MRTARAPRFAAVDASTIITREQAEFLYYAGYRTIFRYLDRIVSDPDKDDTWPYNLIRSELDMLLDVGLYVSPVQYFSTPQSSTKQGAMYSRAYGETVGKAAALNAKALGVPTGVTIWCDLEECPRASPQMITDYLNGWSEAVSFTSPGYACGLYVGANLGSPAAGGYYSGTQLYKLPRFRAYWRAASLVPQVPNRGWTVIQGLQIKIGGVMVDQNMIALDHRATSSRDRFLVVAP
jgi:hypothetical protein